MKGALRELKTPFIIRVPMWNQFFGHFGLPFWEPREKERERARERERDVYIYTHSLRHLHFPFYGLPFIQKKKRALRSLKARLILQATYVESVFFC